MGTCLSQDGRGVPRNKMRGEGLAALKARTEQKAYRLPVNHQMGAAGNTQSRIDPTWLSEFTERVNTLLGISFLDGVPDVFFVQGRTIPKSRD